MSIREKAIYICLSLIMITSCGGGGGSDTPSGNGSNNSNIINQDIQGSFFEVCGVSLCTMDAKTGRYAIIPNTDYVNQRDKFPYAPVTDFIATTVTNDKTEFLLIADEVSGSKVIMQDYNGNMLTELDFNIELITGFLSQDHQYVALFTRTGSISNTPRFEIYNRSGQNISSTVLQDRQLIWLPNNRILYSSYRTFYFTKPASTENDYTLTLPSSDTSSIQPGLIGDKAISPDGSQIVFNIAERGQSLTQPLLNARLYIMNIDGTDVRLLATTYNDEDPRLSAPSWSADGRWLLLTEGYRPSNVGIDDDSLGRMYLIPMDNQRKVYYLSENDAERSPEVKLFKRYYYDTGNLTTRGDGTIFPWLP